MRTRPAMTLTDAHQMMAACKAEAQKNNWKVAIAIVDDAGYLLLFERMDGTGPTSAEVASRQSADRCADPAAKQVLGRSSEGAAGVPELSRGPDDSRRVADHVSK